MNTPRSKATGVTSQTNLEYLARVVLADDDPQLRTAAAAAIDPRHLKFDTSGLSLEVPAKTPVQLQVLRR